MTCELSLGDLGYYTFGFGSPELFALGSIKSALRMITTSGFMNLG